MSRVYATVDGTGERMLVRIECDEPCCEAIIKPNPDIMNSGWTKSGSVSKYGTTEYNWCPEHEITL